MYIKNVIALIALILLGTGCAFSTAETARQLQQGEIVASGSLDLPGYVVIPRANANVIYGLGAGDISAHVGTTIVTANAGLGGRVYLGDHLMASLQFDGIYNFDPVTFEFFLGDNEIGVAIVSLTPRLTTTVEEDQLFYTGIQAHILGSFNRHPDTGMTYNHGNSLLGGLVGIDHLFAGGRWGFQGELSIMPVLIDTEEGIGIFSEPPFTYGELSVGLYYRWP